MDKIPQAVQDALKREYKVYSLAEINPWKMPMRETNVSWHTLIVTVDDVILGNASQTSSSLIVDRIKFRRGSDGSPLENPGVKEIEITDIVNIYQVSAYIADTKA